MAAGFAFNLFRNNIYKKSTVLLRSNNFHPESSVQPSYYGIRLLKTEIADEDLIEKASVSVVQDDEVSLRQEELERKRDKSRLRPYHRNLVHGKIPYPESMEWFHETVKYKRKMYGRYGQASGVTPGVMWPTKEDLEDIKEYERVAYPDTFEEMLKKLELKKREEEIAIKER